MSDITFTTKWTKAGTDAQKNVGIMASFDLEMRMGNDLIMRARDMKLKRSKDGQYYIESAFREYDGKDKQTGEPKKQRVRFVELFPEERDGPKKEAIIRMVLNDLNGSQGTSASQSKSAAAPAAKTAAPTKPASKEAW